jgi:hypothetical protein
MTVIQACFAQDSDDQSIGQSPTSKSSALKVLGLSEVP